MLESTDRAWPGFFMARSFVIRSHEAFSPGSDCSYRLPDPFPGPFIVLQDDMT